MALPLELLTALPRAADGKRAAARRAHGRQAHCLLPEPELNLVRRISMLLVLPCADDLQTLPQAITLRMCWRREPAGCLPACQRLLSALLLPAFAHPPFHSRRPGVRAAEVAVHRVLPARLLTLQPCCSLCAWVYAAAGGDLEDVVEEGAANVGHERGRFCWMSGALLVSLVCH